MLTLVFLPWLACSGTTTSTDSGPTGSDSDSTTTGTTDSGASTDDGPPGCLSGRLRDVNTNSAGRLTVTAYSEGACAELGTTISEADGTFCLSGLPVGESVVLQVIFAERCPWAHGKTLSVQGPGTCETSGCDELDTWYECDGEAASCP